MFQCSRNRMCNCCVNSDPCSIRQIASMTSARSWIPASSRRVRQLKAALGESIYHPGVLATLAPYNAAFGDRFQRCSPPPHKKSRISPTAWKNSGAAF